MTPKRSSANSKQRNKDRPAMKHEIETREARQRGPGDPARTRPRIVAPNRSPTRSALPSRTRARSARAVRIRAIHPRGAISHAQRIRGSAHSACSVRASNLLSIGITFSPGLAMPANLQPRREERDR